MASITSRKNGTKLLQFKDQTGRRRTIQLGNMTMRSATSIRGKVEAIISCKLASQPIDDETNRWLNGLDSHFLQRLSKAGLIDALRF